jgi:hypothetical protein
MARRSPRTRRDRRRAAGAIGLLGASLFAAVKSADAIFLARVTKTHTTSTGTLSVAMSDSDVSQSFNVGIGGMYPGVANKQRLVTLTIGDTSFATLSLTATLQSASTALDSPAATGIGIVVERCSVPWTASGSSPNRTYTCSGATTGWVAESPNLIGTKNLTTGSNLTAGSVNYFRFSWTLPNTAPASSHGATDTVRYTFSGTQRSGTSN